MKGLVSVCDSLFLWIYIFHLFIVNFLF
uniref:Uncharacterized protein n=1 Tax=Rhizophora mucronata TaxID=61149 RepID=A0A2P2P517_RHIMU